MLLPYEERGHLLWRRQGPPSDGVGSDGGGGPNGATIAAIVVIVCLAIAAIVFFLFRNKRKTKTNNKYLPGDTFFSRLKRWGKPSSTRGKYGAELQPNPSAPSLIGRDGRRSRDTSQEPPLDRRRSDDPERGTVETQEASNDTANTIAGAGVDRNTSVRSVMTLPAYTPSARESERIIAREGERGGIDTVVEFPETQEDEENRRDEEMESLYQIRRQRRQEQADREDRRRQRREARDRGDFDALRRLQQESRQRAESAANATSAALIAEHQAAMAVRDRRVSSVQYAELGVARHDGSRIRANSTDSDNRPLLDSAASISGMSLGQPSMHSRGRSASSVLSVSTANGSENGDGTPHIDSDGFEVVSLEPTQTTRSAAASTHRGSEDAEEADVTDLGIQIPTELPPDYDDPPDYTSPMRMHASVRSMRSNGPPRLPSLRSIPSIEVTGAVSPLTPTPTSEGLPSIQRFTTAPLPSPIEHR